MCGNGVAIGMTIIARHRRRIQRDQTQALTACIVVAVGPTLRTAAEFRLVTVALPTTATTASGSVW